MLTAGAPPTNPAESSKPALRKALGRFDGIFILLAVTIGAGIFATPQRIATCFPSFSVIVLCWIAVGAYAFAGGLIYAELGTRLPLTGGAYVYLNRCYSPHVAFLYGWKSFFLTSASSRAGLAIVAADYLGSFVTLSERTHLYVALAFLFAAGALNYAGIRWAVLYQKFSASVKVGGLLALVGLGLFAVGGQPNLLSLESPPTSSLPPLLAVAQGLMLIYFTYTGWERVVVVAGEMKNPRRAIPVAMLGGLGLIIVIYLLINWLYFRTLGIEGVRESRDVVSVAAQRLFGGAGGRLVALMVIISATGGMCVSIMSSTRIYYAMAKDGLFFHWFNYVHPVFRTPSRAIAVHVLVAALMMLFRSDFVELVMSVVFINVIFSGLKAATIFKLRRESIGEPDAFKIPLYPVLPILYLLGMAGIFAIRLVFDWKEAWTDLAFVAIGIPVSVLWLKYARGNHAPEKAQG